MNYRRPTLLLLAASILAGTCYPVFASGTLLFRIPELGMKAAPVTSDSTSADTLTFGGVTLGSSSSAQGVTLANTGNTAIGITSVANTGPFTVSTNCSSSLSTGSSCSANVVFVPTSMGVQTGTLTFSTSGGDRSVSLAGTGLQTSETLSPSSLAFGYVPWGASSSSQTVQLTNTGNTTITVGTAVPSTAYSVTGSCPVSLAGSASCTLSVTYTPTAMGAQSGTLTIPTSAGNQVVTLSGTGVEGIPQVNPSALAFATTNVGSSSASQTVTLSNSGNWAYTITASPSVTGPYSITANTCSGSVAASSTCTVSVDYVPTASGTQTGTLSIPTSSGTMSVSLTGTGLVGTPKLAENQSTLSWDFSDQGSGEHYSGSTVTLSNSGTANLTITGTSVSPQVYPPVAEGAAGFTISGCAAGTVLAPGQTCALTITGYCYQGDGPTSTGATGTATVTSTGGNVSVSLSVSPGMD